MISVLHIQKIDFQLPGNLTDDSVILDTVQLPVKNHLFWVSLKSVKERQEVTRSVKRLLNNF